jgi:hypothetical protein
MKIVPVTKSADLERSLRFYTEVLDFERKWPGEKEREMANGAAQPVCRRMVEKDHPLIIRK